MKRSMPRVLIVQPEHYRLIPLTKGQIAKVDINDFEWLNEFNWCAFEQSTTPGKYYAVRRGPNGKILMMHTEIFGELFPDHKNGDGLDNRRGNLRSATPSQNMHNVKPLRTNTTGHKGVWKHTDGRFRARIEVDGQRINLGIYATPEQAARAYRNYSRSVMGEFSVV